MGQDGLTNPAARLFSNPAGDYGSMVNERVGASSWESGAELGDTWASRNAFSYGRWARVAPRLPFAPCYWHGCLVLLQPYVLELGGGTSACCAGTMAHMQMLGHAGCNLCGCPSCINVVAGYKTAT